MKMWVDDIRPPPDAGWTWIKTSEGACAMLKRGALIPGLAIEEISLDHDLGGDDTAMSIAKLLEEGAYSGCLPRLSWAVHSANPVGRANLIAALRQADYFWAFDRKPIVNVE